MYVSEICAEGIFVAFPCWLKNVKSRSKIALFSNERHFAIWFPKKKTITFFWSKLSKLHKNYPILHVATTFSLKQGETRTSHGPIPHPLTCLLLSEIDLKLKFLISTQIIFHTSEFSGRSGSKLVDFGLMLNCFGPVRSGENIIGSVRGRGHKMYNFSVRSGSGQKITGQYGIGVPKTLPRRTLLVM